MRKAYHLPALPSLQSPDIVLAGLALDIQLLAADQDVPTKPSDYQLDALIVGSGTIIRR